MNINEVVANIALQNTGRLKGRVGTPGGVRLVTWTMPAVINNHGNHSKTTITVLLLQSNVKNANSK
jgi:hypothetical protein